MEGKATDLPEGSARGPSEAARRPDEPTGAPQGPQNLPSEQKKGKEKDVSDPMPEGVQTVTANGMPQGDVNPTQRLNPLGMPQEQQTAPEGSGGPPELPMTWIGVTDSTANQARRTQTVMLPVGSLSKQKRKRLEEQEPHDEGPVAASLSTPKAEQGAAGVPEEASALEGTGGQGEQLGDMHTKEGENLNDRQRLNEADFLKRVREHSLHDNTLRHRKNRKSSKSFQKDGLWWRKTGAEQMALYIPPDEGNALRNECIEWVHKHPFTGHVGVHRTSEILRKSFWWPRMEQDITQYVKNCEMCCRNKSTNRKKAGLLAPLPVPGKPWESIGMDFITHSTKD